MGGDLQHTDQSQLSTDRDLQHIDQLHVTASTLISPALHLGKEYINKRFVDSIRASCNVVTASNVNRDVVMRCNAVERTRDSHHYQINTLTNVLSNYDNKN